MQTWQNSILAFSLQRALLQGQLRYRAHRVCLCSSCLRLRLLWFVLVSVIVPDVATQRVVGLEMFPAELTDVRQVLVELLEVLVELSTAATDLPVVLLELVALEQLGLEEDLGAEAAGVLVLPGLPVVLHDAAGVD